MRRAEQIAEEISILLPRLLRGMRAGFVTTTLSLTTSQLVTLLTIYEKGGSKGSDLSKELRVSAPTITGIIDRLTRNGYLKRIPDKDDRRIINIQLTNKGLNAARDFLKEVRKRWTSILIHLSAGDRENYLKILKRILVVLGGSNE